MGLSPGRAPPLQPQPDDRHAVESSLLELAAVNRRLEEEQVFSELYPEDFILIALSFDRFSEMIICFSYANLVVSD